MDSNDINSREKSSHSKDNYKIRLLNLKNKEEALSEFGKIGAEPAGCHIMANKFFNFAIKIDGVNFVGANILKQEMLSRGGDVVTSRETLCGYRHKEKRGKEDSYKTSVIILGTKKSIRSLVEKIKIQPFGLRHLSLELNDFLNRLDRIEKRRILKIKDKEFDLEEETLVMGILNVTPDSFYDGGLYFEKEKAFKRVKEIVEEGAHIIDVGGMSTRPGSLPISVDEEIERVIPIIEHIKKNYDIPVSIDTYHSEVARVAVERGASIINDISGLTFDENMAEVAARTGSMLVVMHIKGTPKDMQENPQYEDVIDEVYDYLYG
ncbi:MAG: dihydropteroate synthase, partial [Actinobacteria bacterium]|nr:dihydropteroate synthase [Actinomycetota bacterium]